MTKLSDRVRERREDLGLSQEQVAKACGVSQQAIHNLEAGEVERPRYLDELIEILETSKEWLKTGRGLKIVSVRQQNYTHSGNTVSGVGDNGYTGEIWDKNKKNESVDALIHLVRSSSHDTLVDFDAIYMRLRKEFGLNSED